MSSQASFLRTRVWERIRSRCINSPFVNRQHSCFTKTCLKTRSPEINILHRILTGSCMQAHWPPSAIVTLSPRSQLRWSEILVLHGLWREWSRRTQSTRNTAFGCLYMVVRF